VLCNRKLRRTFGHTADNVTGGSRKLHKEEGNIYIIFFAKCYWIHEVEKYEVDGEYKTHGEISLQNVY
jgi:hypothetical protein